MEYLILIVLIILTAVWVQKKTFLWETVIKHLWKGVYIYADQMASHMKQFNISGFDKLSMQGFKSQIDLRGNLINSILDFINALELEENINAKEETFGYGRYKFETILMMAKTHPSFFEKLK